MGLNGSVLTAPVCQRCTVLAQGGLCRTANKLSVTSSAPTPARPHPQNEHLFAASFSASAATCRLTAGRLSVWLHSVFTLPHRPLSVQYLKKKTSKALEQERYYKSARSQVKVKPKQLLLMKQGN